MDTSATTITEIAEKVIDSIVGTDTRRCIKLSADRYEISEVGGASDHSQIVTSSHIAAGLYAWAGEMITQPSDVDDEIIARAISDGRWTEVATLLSTSETDATLDIWDLIGQIAVTSAA